jgi:hypothetical protein
MLSQLIGGASATFLPPPRWGPPPEAPDLIAFTVTLIFLSPFSAQKTHVKPKNPITPYTPTTSIWRISSIQLAIIEIGIKKKTRPSRVSLLRKGIAPLTHLNGII